MLQEGIFGKDNGCGVPARTAMHHCVHGTGNELSAADRLGNFRYFDDRQAQLVLNLRTSMKLTAVPLKRAGSTEAVLMLKPSA